MVVGQGLGTGNKQGEAGVDTLDAGPHILHHCFDVHRQFDQLYSLGVQA